MHNPDISWRPSLATFIAATLVVLGILLTSVSWWFLMLAALGAVGPAFLREIGLLHDQDEFQRLAAYRAGFHAYLITIFIAFALVAFFRSSEQQFKNLQEIATVFLSLTWFTWFLSSLISYWGTQKAAFRILICFGVIWLAFTVLSNTGSEWRGWLPLLLHPLLSIPFFALAIGSKRWPRISGLVLVAAAIFFMNFFGIFKSDNLNFINQAVTLILFIGPLLACGLALLGTPAGSNEIDED